jgi:TatD DNase family protein
LAPVPYRGKKNQPGYLPEIGKFAGELFGSEIEQICWYNALSFYQIAE